MSAKTRRRQAAGQHREPGLGRREAEQRLREQRKEERAAEEAEAEHDEQEDRRGEVAVLEHAELDDRMLVALRQLPPEQRRRATRRRRSTDRMISVARRTSPRCSLPRARTAASRRRR